MTKDEQTVYDSFVRALPREHSWFVDQSQSGPQHVIEVYTFSDPNRKYMGEGPTVAAACAKCIRKIKGIGIPV